MTQAFMNSQIFLAFERPRLKSIKEIYNCITTANFTTFRFVQSKNDFMLTNAN